VTITKPSGDKQKIILDWVTISYREILGAILVLILGLGAAVALWYVYFRAHDPKEIAATEIRVAERGLGRAASVVPPEREDLAGNLSRAREELTSARELFRRGDYDLATSAAGRSQKFSEEIYNAIGGKIQAVATLGNIGGNVDYRRVNSQRWQPAYNGLQLFQGDKVRTLSGSGAELRYSQGATGTLDENMLMTLVETTIDRRTGTPEVGALLERGTFTVETTEDSGASIRTPEAEAVIREPGQLRGARDPGAEQTEFASDAGATVRSTSGEEFTLGGREGIVVDPKGVVERFEWIRPPALTRPPSGKVFVFRDPSKARIDLDWEAVPNAAHYRLEISRLPIFTGNLHYGTDLKVTSAPISAPPLGAWWWRVYTVSPDGRRSLPSESRRFQVRTREAATGEAPSIEVKEPPYRLGTKVLIEGTTDPNVLLTFSVNDGRETSITVDASGTFGEFVPLTRVGLNIILLRAQSPSGAVTEKAIKVPYENY